MCYYIPILHRHCGCITFEVPVPNPCHDALKNSLPCLYIPEPPSRPNSLDSAPSLAHTTSTVSHRSSNSFHTHGSDSSLIALTYGTYQHPIDAFKEDEVVKEMSLCPFHEEDWDERDFEKSGKELLHVGHKTVARLKRQRKSAKKMKDMGYGRRGEKRKRKRDSPQKKRSKSGLWESSVANEEEMGTVVNVGGNEYLVTDGGVEFLGFHGMPF